MIARLLREPFVHFLALGAGLFVLFAHVGAEDPAAHRIVIGPGTIEAIDSSFQLAWQRPPTREELDGLVDDHVREEIYAREARALGLDRDDVVVNRRLRQKMELLAASAVEASEPSDADLETWLRDRPERYRLEPRLSFRHVFLSRERRGAATEADAARVLARLRAGADPATLGDPLPVRSELRDASLSEVARELGQSFATQLAEMAPGEWQGPIDSAYGTHLVRVESRSEGRLPALAEVRDAVLRDFESERTGAAQEAFYQSLRQRYQVVIDAPALAPAPPR